MRRTHIFRRGVAALLVTALFLGLLWMEPRAEEATPSPTAFFATEESWNIPTLADTTLRAGRSTIKKTAEQWHSYLSVKESLRGLTFRFSKAPATVFEGLSHKLDLNGLFLKFSGYEKQTQGSDPIFALSFGKGEYERFGFGLIFELKSGRIYAAQGNGSTLAEVGDPILQDTALTSAELKGQDWILSLEETMGDTYTLRISIGTRIMQGEIPRSVIENGQFDPHSCCMSLMAVRSLPIFSLTLEGWRQAPVPRPLRESDTLLRGTGNYGNTLSNWEKWLTVTEKEQGGLRYDFTGAAHSVTEGLTLPLSLEGLRFHFSGLCTSDEGKLGRLALTFGTGNMARSSFGLLFEFGKGRIYASNPEVTNGTLSAGRVTAVGEPLFSGETFQYANMAGKDWFVDFAAAEGGNYEVAIEIDGQRHCAIIDGSVVRNDKSFLPEHCYGYLMSAQGSTTLTVDLLSLTRYCLPSYIQNGGLLPAYIPPTESPVDENGTPEWLSSATIMEVNIPKATKEGTLEAALPVLDHARDMGVNCLWITAIGEPGPKNDGSAGNHYVNLGVQSIDPAITGTNDYEEGWQVFASFVEEAHKRNIYILFNAVTWGTSPTSPIYKEHPQWYTGSDIWGGKEWDWTNEELIAWYTETLLDIVETTGIDGILYDCEPKYAGEAVCSRFRKAIRDSGRNLVYISESVNDRGEAYDMELYGVMDYRGYSTVSAAIGAHQKDDKDFFTEEGHSIVDSVKNGSLSGNPTQQTNGTGGTHKYYSYCFSNHDSYYYAFQNNLLDVAYEGIFAPYIPIWSLGDEFNSTASGIRLYFDTVKWCNLASVEHNAFYEGIKEMLRIRRQYSYVFDQASSNHRNANICSVEVEGDLGLEAYGRYADNTGILILGNRNQDGNAVTARVTVPFEAMDLSKYDTFTLTDLITGEQLCRGTRDQVTQFAVTLEHNAIGVYAIRGTGTAREGVTIARGHHALLRNGTAHQINTALQSWGNYLQVEEQSTGGLRFAFTEAVTTVTEGINVPLSLENLSLHFSNLQNYVNHGSTSAPSKIALSFGPGGYVRNSFGLVFDFAGGAIYGAKPKEGTTDRLTQDKTPLLKDDRLKAEFLKGKEWSLELAQGEDGAYLLTVFLGDTFLRATIDSSYILPTETFDPTSCYLYISAAGAKPTVTFDLIGWGSAFPNISYYVQEDVVRQRGDPILTRDIRGRGLNMDLDRALPLTGIKLAQELHLNGTTLFFDDLTNYRSFGEDSGRFALSFSSPNSEDTALAISLDPQRGTVYLCINGCTYRDLLQDVGLTYEKLRDVQWSLSFVGNADGGMDVAFTLPHGTYGATITEEELTLPRNFDPASCRLSLLAWDGPLDLSVRLVGYDSWEKKDESIRFFHSLSLESSIAMNFMIPQEDLAVYDSFTLLCHIPVYEGTEQIGTRTVELQPEAVSNGYYRFVLGDMTALQMNDTIQAQLKLKKGETPYCSNIDTYSVATYAYKQLNNTGATEKLKTLCANLLRYGAVAQSWKGYRTDSLADSLMTQEHIALLTDLNTVTFQDRKATLSDLDAPSITWIGTGLSLESRVVVRFVFDTGAYEGDPADLTLHVSYVNCKGETVQQILEGAKPYSTIENRYVFDLDTLLASEMRAVISGAVYHKETRLSQTRQYSIDSYGMGKTGSLLTLNQAMVAYGDSAAAYFAG